MSVHPVAHALRGVPFRLHGRIGHATPGVDCVGLTLAFLAALGIESSDPWDVELDRSMQAAVASATVDDSGWTRVDGRPPALGDVALYQHGTGWHVAPFVGGGYVLHARTGADSVLGQVRHLPAGTTWWTWHGTTKSGSPSRSRSSATLVS